MDPIGDLPTIVRNLSPVLNAGTYVFATLPAGRGLDAGLVVASIRESEGLSVVVEASVADREGLAAAFRCAWITLSVHSDLQSVGLTAAFSTALGRAGISCNVVAGTHHDHIFVPEDLAEAAMDVLRHLQRSASG